MTLKQKNKNIKMFLSLPLAIALPVIVGVFIPMLGFLPYVGILYCIYTITIWIRDQKNVSKIKSGDTINYIFLNEKEICINLYNKTDDMFSIKWDLIVKIDFHYTIPRSTFNSYSLAKLIDWIPNVKLFDRKDEEKYFSLFFRSAEDKNPFISNTLDQFQIPSSWITSNQFGLLVQQIHDLSGIKIKPFEYLKASVGLVKDDFSAIRNQKKLDIHFQNCLSGTFDYND